MKLISTGQLFNKFEAQLQSKSTQRLFRYLRTTEGFSNLSVADLRGHLSKMKRKDVLGALIEHRVKGLLMCLFSGNFTFTFTLNGLSKNPYPLGCYACYRCYILAKTVAVLFAVQQMVDRQYCGRTILQWN